MTSDESTTCFKECSHDCRHRTRVSANQEHRDRSHEGAGLSRSGQARLGRDAPPGDPEHDRRHRPDHHLHHLRYRPAHPEGRPAGCDAGPDSRARGHRRRDGGGYGGHGRSSRRSGDHLLCHGLREVRLLSERHVLALPRRGLDPRQHHRRHAGGARAHPACRHESLPLSCRRRRRSARHAERHPADRLRVRRAERSGEAWRHGRHRRCRPDRSGRPADGAVLFASCRY